MDKTAEAEACLEVLINLENWLIQAEDFLGNFKAENKATILQKAQDQIAICQQKLEVLLEIKQEKAAVIKKNCKHFVNHLRYKPKIL
ncbi:hypothetical protein [Algoriphagus boritolerans]|uniref:hypothetical protein n=1 Tax=Algoriphagus boritolerans TaxID=308111 RepID=UPI002FCE40BF